MFSLMTALLSPKVMETVESHKELLFQTLTERAGVLCIQPSNGICLLQGEWECMKKAHLVLEELCLQVQAQDRVQALMQARQKAYHDIQANYQRMAEEAIKGLTRESPNSQASLESGHEESPPRLQPQTEPQDEMDIAPPSEPPVAPLPASTMAAAQHPNGLEPPNLDSMAPQEPSPVSKEDTVLNSTNMNGSKSDDENLNNNKENIDESSAVTGNGNMATLPEEQSSAPVTEGTDHEEDRDSEGGLRIAMSEEEDDEDDGSSLPHDDVAQNLSVRPRTSDASEGNGPSPFSPTSYSPGQAGDLPRSRPYEAFITQASEMKPDVGQLRAMAAQYYAMQQSVFNYSYLTAEARKFLETRMGGNMREPDLRMMSQGLPFPGQPPVAPRQDHQAKDATGNQVPPGSQPPIVSANFSIGPTDLSVVPRRQENLHNDDKSDKKSDWSDDGHFKPKYLTEENGEHAAEQNDRPRYLQQRQEWPGEKAVYGSMVLGTGGGLVGGQTGDYQCPACMGTFPTRDAVQEHMLQTHAVGPGLQGDRTKPLSPHINTTSMADAYCCPICGKFYKSGQRLREHILLHDKNYQRPQYPCPVCGKTFTYRHNMKVHFQKIHKGKQPIKRHECTVCGQKFHKPVYLRHHLLRHKETLYGGLSYKTPDLSPPTQLTHGMINDGMMNDTMAVVNHNQATTSCS